MRRPWIVAVLCLLILSAAAWSSTLVWARTSASRTAGALVGNPTVGPRVRSARPGLAEAFRFRSRSAGPITAIRVYIDSHNAATSIVAGLYSNRNGRPDRRLASGSLSRPDRGAWNTVIVRSTTVAARQTYWIAVLGRGGKLYLRVRTKVRCSRENSTRIGVKSLPLRWGAGRYSLSCGISAYGRGGRTATGVTVPGGASARIGPVTTPSPPPSTGCAPDPHLCGFPDSTNTGVPTGTTLAAVPGQVTSGPGWSWNATYGELDITTDGTVVKDLNVTEGSIVIKANNVTIEDTKVVQTGSIWAIGLYSGVQNATIQDSTITGTTDTGPNALEVGLKDIYGNATGTQIVRDDFSDATTSVQISNGTVKDSYIHNFGLSPGAHLNGISDGGGDPKPLLIQHNTILNQIGQTDAIALFQDFGDESNKTITDNLLAGGSYTVYGGGPNSACPSLNGTPGCEGPSDHIVITNNHFSRIFQANGGTFGYGEAFNASGVGNVWHGNAWDDTGATVPAP